jgi:hypothetical protein
MSELFNDDEKKPQLDWSWVEPYRKPLTRLFYRIFYYKHWKPDWGFGDNWSVCNALLGGGGDKNSGPLKDFMSRVMDSQLSYISKQPMLDIFAFDDWLHKEFGNYENEGLSMKDLIALKFDQDTLQSIEILIGGKK